MVGAVEDMGAVALAPGTVGTDTPADAGRRPWREMVTPHRVLIGVALIHMITVLPGLLSAPTLLWDEVVYASQFATGTQPAQMSAPRAWGMPLMLAPVDVFTYSVSIIRAYLMVLSGVGMYLAFRPWLGIVERWVAPVAALLFATLWTTAITGSMAYPNLWLAYAVVGGIGLACTAVSRPGDRRLAAAILVAFAIASLIRPSDAAFAAAPLLLLLAVRRAWPTLAAVGAGVAVGWVAWLVEAQIRFGGPLARLSDASATTDSRLNLDPRHLLTSVDGPYLFCRPASLCHDIHLLEVLWWLALPLLALAGIWVSRHRSAMLLMCATAASLALSYGFLFDWSNPRNLQPTYALLAIPVATAVVWTARRRALLLVVVALLVVAHAAAQVRTFERVESNLLHTSRDRMGQLSALRDAAGVVPPCVLFGPGSIELSFLTHCRPVYSAVAPSPEDPKVQAAVASGQQVVLRLPDGARPQSMKGWLTLKLSPSHDRWAYVSERPPSPTP